MKSKEFVAVISQKAFRDTQAGAVGKFSMCHFYPTDPMQAL